jgi:hypothetical protein
MALIVKSRRAASATKSSVNSTVDGIRLGQHVAQHASFAHQPERRHRPRRDEQLQQLLPHPLAREPADPARQRRARAERLRVHRRSAESGVEAKVAQDP